MMRNLFLLFRVSNNLREREREGVKEEKKWFERRG